MRVAASLLLPAALAACSAPAATPAPVVSSAGAPAPSPSVPLATSVASAMADGALTGEHCQKGPDGVWTYAAALTNHDTARESFTVAVGLTRATAVLDHALVEKTLAPGETAQVTATGFGKDTPAAGTDCAATVSKERTQ